MLLENVKANLQNEGKLLPGDVIVAAVSGGADSMALLHALVQCGYRPIVAHFNHRIRTEAERDLQFVKNAAAAYELDFVSGSADVRAQALERGETLEEAARNARYRFLFAAAIEKKARAVLTAHQADDQVETVIMNLLRGSGLNGLGGMRVCSFSAYHAEIPLVRPLLDCWREEILEYCRQEHIEFVIDETNQDTAYRRNRIRLELIPQLENYNPKIKQTLLRTSQLAAEDRELLDELLHKALAECQAKIAAAYGGMALDPFRKLAPAMRRYVVRYFLRECFAEESDLGNRAIEDACRFFNCELGSKSLQLNDQILLRLEGEKGTFMPVSRKDTPDEARPYILEDSELVVQPGVYDLGGSWKIGMTLISAQECGDVYRRNEDGFTVFLDADRAGGRLLLRHWHSGDRYCPLGMGGRSVKVSDFWVDHKVPLRAKNHWPLVFSGNDLIWIPGFQPADFAKVTDETHRILVLKVFQD